MDALSRVSVGRQDIAGRDGLISSNKADLLVTLADPKSESTRGGADRHCDERHDDVGPAAKREAASVCVSRHSGTNAEISIRSLGEPSMVLRTIK